MLHWTDVVDAESSQAFHAKLSGTKGAALEVGAELLESEFGVLLEPQLASTNNAATTALRANLCDTWKRDFIDSA